MSIDPFPKQIFLGVQPASRLRRNRFLRCSTGYSLLLISVLVLAALPRVVSQATPYSVSDVEKLAKAGMAEQAFLESVKQHGVAFAPTLEVMEELKASHVPDSVLKEIWSRIPQGQAPEFYLREGDRLLQSGYYAEAVAYYQRILVQVPDDPVAKARMQQAEEARQKAEAQAEEARQNAEAKVKLRAAQDNERPNLPYYRDQLRSFLQKPDCNGAFFYAHKIFFVGPDLSEKSAYEKACGPYTVTLEGGSPVTLAFERELTGSGAHAGDKVDFTVVEPIVVNGLLIVPKGGVAWGTIAKSSGEKRAMKGGVLEIRIEGMSLADGEKCSLASLETVHGKGKSKGTKTFLSILTVEMGGIPLPFLMLAHGKDAKIAAGTKVAAHVAEKVNFDPDRFELSGSPPSTDVARIQLPPATVTGLSVISFQNQTGTDVSVRLLGPSAQSFTLADGKVFSAHVAAGNYQVLVRYGIDPKYLFSKAGPVAVTEPSGQHSVVHITLQLPGADNPNAREEFYKSQ